VLHKENVENVEAIYEFFEHLSISFRLLPAEVGLSAASPPRLRELALSNKDKLQAFKRLAIYRMTVITHPPPPP